MASVDKCIYLKMTDTASLKGIGIRQLGIWMLLMRCLYFSRAYICTIQVASVADITSPASHAAASLSSSSSSASGGGYRQLALKLTDGKVTCKAVEYRRCDAIHESLPPGTKVRRGHRTDMVAIRFTIRTISRMETGLCNAFALGIVLRP